MMKLRFTLLTAATVVLTTFYAAGSFAEGLPRKTALDDYVNKPDDSYSWKVDTVKTVDGITTVIVDMVSQTWRTKEDVDRTEWRHWLTVSIPDKVTSDVGMLYISGGYNSEKPRENRSGHAICKGTGGVVAELGMVPNQTLMFHNDGKQRTEDDLIGYTWDQFLKTGDVTWPARNPMVKSAVRAMDTITALLAQKEYGEQTVDQFVVAGGSKRGWTTWLTGAVDDRVVGIVPIVIDVLNADLSMRHHFANYGFWAPSVGNYVDHKLMTRLDHPRMKELYELVDPYYYRHRLTMPKLILNAAGDQFFLPDSSRFYWDDLRGENYIRYVPNGDHSLRKTDAVESIVAFYTLIQKRQKPPQISWTESDAGVIQVMTQDKPSEVRLWQATNPEARDFRMETLGKKYTSTIVEPQADGTYVGKPETPENGWTAYFMEFKFDVGAATPLKITTEVLVTPDTIPFADKPSDLPTSFTLVCTAPSEDVARSAAETVGQLMIQHKITAKKPETVVQGKRLYVNWTSDGDFRKEGKLVGNYLQSQKCDNFSIQLESGPGITLPPAVSK